MADWDADSNQLDLNLKELLATVRDAARAREVPTAAVAKAWHRDMMRGLDVPNPAYVGAFRGESGLERINVRVGTNFGVPAREVAEALAAFEARFQRSVAVLDAVIPPGSDLDTDRVAAVIELCAWVHAEWIRIHPLANGNGRIARLWVADIVMRYRLPIFLRLRPRPDGDYGRTAAAAMSGNWEPTERLFRKLYVEAVRR